MTESVTLTDEIACLKREAALRANVYPKWVESGRLSQEMASFGSAVLSHAIESLERLEAMDRAAEQAARPCVEYVLGYALCDHGTVMMMRKAHGTPSGAGLNGIGGRIEDGETPADAMTREWREETGRHEPEGVDAFKRVGDFRGVGFIVHVFAAGPMDSWPILHGESPPDASVCTVPLVDLLRRDPLEKHGLGRPTTLEVCPWVPTTLAMAFLEHLRPSNKTPSLHVHPF